MFGDYDPDRAAGYQDADIEMSDARDAANEQYARCQEGHHEIHNTNCIHCGASREDNDDQEG